MYGLGLDWLRLVGRDGALDVVRLDHVGRVELDRRGGLGMDELQDGVDQERRRIALDCGRGALKCALCLDGRGLGMDERLDGVDR